MKSVHYEELCRLFLAQTTGLPVEKVVSVRIPNPQRADLPQYDHQIDLYWETGDNVCLYLNIANAKWRSSSKVDQGEILLLQQVKQKVSAHKAVMITNTEFTSGAQAAARDEGIALHIVQPAFDPAILSISDRGSIQQKFEEMAAAATKPLFEHTVCHRAFDLAGPRPAHPSIQQHEVPAITTRVMPGYSTRVAGGLSHRGGTLGGGSAGGPASGAGNRGGGGGGFRTR